MWNLVNNRLSLVTGFNPEDGKLVPKNVVATSLIFVMFMWLVQSVEYIDLTKKYSEKVKVSHNKPRWPKRFRVG
jgi:hypothetical protein